MVECEEAITKRPSENDVERMKKKFKTIKKILTKDQNGSVALGRYHWLFERLRRPHTKECLKNLLSCLETSK